MSPCECFCSLAEYPFNPLGVMKYSTLPCSGSYTRWFHDSLHMLVTTHIHCTNELKSNNIYNLPIMVGVHQNQSLKLATRVEYILEYKIHIKNELNYIYSVYSD